MIEIASNIESLLFNLDGGTNVDTFCHSFATFLAIPSSKDHVTKSLSWKVNVRCNFSCNSVLHVFCGLRMFQLILYFLRDRVMKSRLFPTYLVTLLSLW